MTHDQWINVACMSFAAAMLVGLITLTWAVCQIGHMCSAAEESDGYIFEDSDPSIFDEEFSAGETVISDTVVRVG